MAVTAPGVQAPPRSNGSRAAEAYEFVRADLGRMMPDYVVINDCIAGQRVIKEKGVIYLPAPEPFTPTAIESKPYLRYLAYLARAVFYNVAQRTLDGLVGEVFLRDPQVKVPSQLNAVVKDANGDGVSLDQQAKLAMDAVLSKGRGGLLVDYPDKDTPTTVAQQASGEIRATIQFYQPEDIINWKTIKRGGKYMLSLVVLKELYDIDEGDGFTTKAAYRFRVLKLVNDAYIQELYTPDEQATPQVFSNIRDGKGKPLTEIPFMFLGSKDNGPKINPAPMLSLCQLNIAHYHNSADYEESVFMMGQPTVVASGLTKQWVDEVLQNEIRVGARGGIPLPVGADAKIIQVMPNTLAFEAMESKEQQMRSLGAKLVEERTVQQTATEAEINSSAETSVLQSCAGNVEKGFKWALEWCGIFEGVINYADDAAARGTQITFEINSDFDIMRLTWQDRQQLLKEWQAHAITTEEYRLNLKRSGVASLSDEEFEAQQTAEIAADMEQQANLIQMQAAASESLKSKDPTTSGGGA